jgi:hypothetical protein
MPRGPHIGRHSQVTYTVHYPWHRSLQTVLIGAVLIVGLDRRIGQESEASGCRRSDDDRVLTSAWKLLGSRTGVRTRPCEGRLIPLPPTTIKGAAHELGNNLVDYLDLDARRCLADMATQPELGIWPQRVARCSGGHSHHPGANGANLELASCARVVLREGRCVVEPNAEGFQPHHVPGLAPWRAAPRLLGSRGRQHSAPHQACRQPACHGAATNTDSLNRNREDTER